MSAISFLLTHGYPPIINPGTIDLFLDKCYTGDLATVGAYLDFGLSPDLTGSFPLGDTPLIKAVSGNRLDVINLLLEHKANIDQNNFYGETPLLTAVISQNLNLVTTLLSHHASPNTLSTKNWTPLSRAISDLDPANPDSDAIFTALIQAKNIDLNLGLPSGVNPLIFAIKKHRLDLVKKLIDLGADFTTPTRYGWTPLMLAQSESIPEIVDLLIKSGATSTLPPNFFTIFDLIKSGDSSAAIQLISAGLPVDFQSQDGSTLAYLAIQSNQRSLFDYLVAHGANLALDDGQGFDLYFAAVRNQNFNYLDLLHSLKVPIADKSGNTRALITATQLNNLEIIKQLISFGASVNSTSNDLTPLSVAIKKEYLPLIPFFIAMGANYSSVVISNLIEASSNFDLKETFSQAITLNLPPSLPKTYASFCQWLRLGHRDMVATFLTSGFDPNPPTKFTETPLTLALKTYNASLRQDLVALLLSHGADPNFLEPNGYTSIFSAITDEVSLKLLLDNGANVNIVSDFFTTPLSAAAKNLSDKSFTCVRLLLAAGAAIDGVGAGATPLISAVKSGNLPLVEFLLDQGANLNCLTVFQENCLHLAIDLGFIDICLLLINRGIDLNQPTFAAKTPLIKACTKGLIEVVKSLLLKGAKVDLVDNDGQTAADYAALRPELLPLFKVKKPKSTPSIPVVVNPQIVDLLYRNCFTEVKKLIEAGASPNQTNYRGDTLLMLAVLKSNLDLVTFLLDHGADAALANVVGDTAWSYGSVVSNSAIQTLLQSRGAKIDHAQLLETANHYLKFQDLVKEGNLAKIKDLFTINSLDLNLVGLYTPLTYAVSRHDQTIVKFLLDLGADINIPNYLGNAPLAEAVVDDDLPLVKFLLTKNANLNQPDLNGFPPLAKTQSLKMLRYLLKTGLIDLKDSLYQNILNTTIDRTPAENLIAALKLLLDYGADINQSDSSGFTPLMNACSIGNREAVSLLLDRGADPSLRHSDGFTAVDFINEEEVEIKKLFIKTSSVTNQLDIPCSINDIWHQISDLSLLPPATPAQIQETEALLSVTFPVDFKDSLLIHNGQSDLASPLIPPWQLLSLENIVREWKLMKNLLDQGDFDTKWWHPAWIPIASNGSGDFCCLNLDSTSGDSFGQVLTFWHENPRRGVLAPSFTHWLYTHLTIVKK